MLNLHFNVTPTIIYGIVFIGGMLLLVNQYYITRLSGETTLKKYRDIRKL